MNDIDKSLLFGAFVFWQLMEMVKYVVTISVVVGP